MSFLRYTTDESKTKVESFMIKQDQLFIHGIKPAYLACKKQPGYEELTHIYPWLDLSYRLRSGELWEQRLFFHHENQKQLFIKRGMIPKQYKPYDEGALGVFLGFPPKAVMDFQKGIEESKRIGIDYHGIGFVCHEKHVVHCIKFLKKHIPVPQHLIEKYQSCIQIDRLIDGKFQKATLSKKWQKVVQ